MDDQKKWEELAARLHGEVSDGNQEQVVSTENIDIEKSIKQIYNSRNEVRKIREFHAAGQVWESLKMKVSGKKRIKELLKYAAVAAVAILTTFSATQLVHLTSDDNQFASVSSPTGQITNLTLFDGTNVWLNAGSTLTYKKTFNQSDREVFLDGEALFEVTKDKSNAFIVNAGKAKIKVHGTTFDVKAYLNSKTVETVLVEGSVEFISNSKSVFIEPGEQLLYSPETSRILITEINTAEYTAWKGGKIYFNNRTLEDLVVQLERWYEVRFRFASDDFKDYRFSGVINRDKSLEYTLEIIEEINKVEFKANKDEILITSKK